MDTQACDYKFRDLSDEYRLHYWRQNNKFSITAVMFTAVHETLLPFLRPCYVADMSAILDPACIFPVTRTARLFGGLMVISAGEHIEVTAADPVTPEDETAVPQTVGTTVTISRSRLMRERSIRTISGVRPNAVGNIGMKSTGLHSVDQPYEEIDPDDGLVKLIPHVLRITSHDQPCCSCHAYADAWNKVSELFKEQSDLIQEYNALFVRIKQLRDQMEELYCDLTKSVLARRDAVSVSDGWQPAWQVEFTVFLSNSRENTVTLPPSFFRLVSENIAPQLHGVVVRKAPAETGFVVTETSGTGFQIDTLTLPSFSRKAVRLQLEITPYNPGSNFADDFGDLKLVWQPGMYTQAD
jgi:hypothetical protein